MSFHGKKQAIRVVRENSAAFILIMEISKTDLQKVIAYLNDAARLYEALGVMPVQKYVSRAHMIRQLTSKLKSKINSNEHR